MQAVIQLLEQGQIKPHIHQRLSLSQASEAHIMLDTGQARGNLVLKP